MTGTVEATIYTVDAVPDEGVEDMWELHIDGIGCTQTVTTVKAKHMVRDYLDVMDICPYDDADVVIRWHFTDDEINRQ
ncbi:hypothetical protein [Haloglycomyces albus]|uniref:hypothetical protein n=1 Tax=Haloglycomyces albus TaxID=526067 RepID=UPI00046D920E|nr:hypothetical protein [Haloglycomyces albus]